MKKMTQKTTLELLDEAFARDGCKRIPVGYTPPRRKAKGLPAKPAKSGGNGKAR